MEKQVTPIEKLLRPFQEFLRTSTSGGILLVITTIIALVWANSPFSSSYFHIWEEELSIGFTGFELRYSLHHWINDGLMAVFFFLVGLEIKREFLVGELSSSDKAILPVAGALGGMIMPALLYILFNAGTEGEPGWGIPMATDIAFVIGIMALLGTKVPAGLKVFIIALAIADDIGAVLVIAFFYTAEISFNMLAFGAGFALLIFLSNILGIRKLLVYTILSIGLWFCFLKSGVHATVAGVIAAFLVPTYARLDTKSFLIQSRKLLDDFDKAGEEGPHVLTNQERQVVVAELEDNCKTMLTPLLRFEHILSPWVNYLIIPIFALANAGVQLSGGFDILFSSPVSLGIIAGLFIGKQTGIFLFSYLAVKLKIASKPEGVQWKQIYGGAIAAGIGFTMSLFIANLAFPGSPLLDYSKTGILAASLISGIVGYIVLNAVGKKEYS